MGTNLLKGSSLIGRELECYGIIGCNDYSTRQYTSDGYHIVTPTTGNANNGIAFIISDFTALGINPGDTITLSMLIKGSSDNNLPFIDIIFQNESTTWYGNGILKATSASFIPTNDYKKVQVSFTIPLTAKYISKRMYLGVHGNMQSDLYIKHIKLELGDTATPWSPSPLDIPSYVLVEDMFEQGSFYAINNGTYESIKTQSGFNYQIRTKELIPCVGEKIAIHISKGYEYFLNFFSNQTNLKKNTGWKSEDKWWDIPEGADHFALVLNRNPEDTSVPMLPSEIAQICGGGVGCMSTKATASITLAKVDDGVDAFTIVYDSPNGLEFSDSVKSIAITAKVFKGGKELTDAEVNKFGAIKWYQVGVAAAIATGKTLTLTAPKEIYATLEN